LSWYKCQYGAGTHCIATSTLIEREEDNHGFIWRTLNYFLLPLLMKRDRVEELKLYMRDLDFKDFVVRGILNREFDVEIYPLDIFYNTAADNCDLTAFEELLTVFHHNYGHITVATNVYSCRDAELYKRLVIGNNYDMNTLAAGFSCMEPEEWLDSVPIDANQKSKSKKEGSYKS
jgi:hypothetical protein